MADPILPSSNSSRSPGRRSANIEGSVQGIASAASQAVAVSRNRSPRRTIRSPGSSGRAATTNRASPPSWRKPSPSVKRQRCRPATTRPWLPDSTTVSSRSRPEASLPSRRSPGVRPSSRASRTGSRVQPSPAGPGVGLGGGGVPSGRRSIRKGRTNLPRRSRCGLPCTTPGRGGRTPVRSLGPARSKPTRQRRPLRRLASRTRSTSCDQTGGSSWAALIRAIAMPAVSNSGIRPASAAADAGSVTMIAGVARPSPGPSKPGSALSGGSGLSGAPGSSSPPGSSHLPRPGARSWWRTARRVANRWASQPSSELRPRRRSARCNSPWSPLWKARRCSRLRAWPR